MQLSQVLRSLAFTALVAIAPLGSRAQPQIPPTVCGPEISTVGDAWEVIQNKLREAGSDAKDSSTAKIPQHCAAILAHLRFIRAGAIMIHGKQRTNLHRSCVSAEHLLATISTNALGGQADGVVEPLRELETVVKFLGTQLPDESLIPSPRFALLIPPIPPETHIQLEPVQSLSPGKQSRVVFQMVYSKDLAPIGPDEVVFTHGARLHALVCDRTLTDFQHLHPKPTGKSGEWAFDFTPGLSTPYRIWINLVPRRTGREEFAMNNISPPFDYAPLADEFRHPANVARTPSLRGEISFGEGAAPRVNALMRGTLRLEDAAGSAVHDLELYMGAFAHLVAIAPCSSTR